MIEIAERWGPEHDGAVTRVKQLLYSVKPCAAFPGLFQRFCKFMSMLVKQAQEFFLVQQNDNDLSINAISNNVLTIANDNIRPHKSNVIQWTGNTALRPYLWGTLCVCD